MTDQFQINFTFTLFVYSFRPWSGMSDLLLNMLQLCRYDSTKYEHTGRQHSQPNWQFITTLKKDVIHFGISKVMLWLS